MKKSFNISDDNDFINQCRSHQDWWRQYILNEEKGKYLSGQDKQIKEVGNRINNGKESGKNFLSDEIRAEVKSALENTHGGIIEQNRLYNNLLSSQPLAFNFFGFFNANQQVALAFLQTIIPDIFNIEEILFEFAPESSGDNSAFDFGFIVRTASGRGFIGFECKYTDTFSYKRTAKQPEKSYYYGEVGDKNYKKYFEIYSESRDRLPDEYSSYVMDKQFNQLFRNELLGIQLKSEYKFDFIITGLFCNHNDKSAVTSGKLFMNKIGNGSDFIVMTYADYFDRIQKLNLSWELRELVMELWARYCGLKLSEKLRT
jgi:hypothetical protein